MQTRVSENLSKVLALKMIVIGMVMGFLLLSTYAVPVPQEVGATGQEGYFTFQSTCTACHGVDSIENYQGSSSWPEIIELMKGYGAFIQAEEQEEILLYLEEAFPR